MASLFDDILLKGVRSGQIPARTVAAREWFRDVAKNTTKAKASPEKILSEYSHKRSAPSIGKMYHFFYDPKHKDTLPYYDRFPLIFMVDSAPGGFYGLNLHYLPPVLRAKLMDKLYTLSTDRRYTEDTKIALYYGILKTASRFKYYKPTFKHYLTKHVRSTFIEIQPTEWDIALMLPTQRFEKASAQKVYSDSRKMI